MTPDQAQQLLIELHEIVWALRIIAIGICGFAAWAWIPGSKDDE